MFLSKYTSKYLFSYNQIVAWCFFAVVKKTIQKKIMIQSTETFWQKRLQTPNKSWTQDLLTKDKLLGGRFFCTEILQAFWQKRFQVRAPFLPSGGVAFVLPFFYHRFFLWQKGKEIRNLGVDQIQAAKTLKLVRFFLVKGMGDPKINWVISTRDCFWGWMISIQVFKSPPYRCFLALSLMILF